MCDEGFVQFRNVILFVGAYSLGVEKHDLLGTAISTTEAADGSYSDRMSTCLQCVQGWNSR